MEQTIQTNLCKGLRATGIPKDKALQILNVIEKWYDGSGVEWTNSRIKDLRQWYETCLTGKPQPPDWFKHSDSGYPLGIWKWVFDQKPGKALGILSLNTVFKHESLSDVQLEKFHHGLTGNQSYESMETFKERLARIQGKWCPGLKQTYAKAEMLPIHFPTLFDMTGSIPVHEGHSTVRPNNHIGEALRALQLSWKHVPKVTFEFLDQQDLLDFMPAEVLSDRGASACGGIQMGQFQDLAIGRVSVIQQPQLKARIVGNPNRVLQATLEPLKLLYMGCARKLPTDVTFDQESGVHWVQEKLRQGYELAGSDLTSASDLLEVERCLLLVDSVFGFPNVRGYSEFESYYLKVCRSEWYFKDEDRNVSWKQGSVLGTGPSFGLLTLSNNACAMLACAECKRDGYLTDTQRWVDCFRVVGDDIIMRSEMTPYYNEWIRRLGGEINFSKTITSDRVAEFAGRIITKDGYFLKAIRYTEPSDNNFLSYIAQLGDQAKFFLQPRQRKVYELLKPVPGIAVPGPWMQDSYGESLSERYQWYLEEVEPALKTVDPDLDFADYDLVLLKARLSLAESGKPDLEGFDEPFSSDAGYLPAEVTPTFRHHGDPRLSNGKTLLDVLYKHVEDGDIMSFEEWKQQQLGDETRDFSSGPDSQVSSDKVSDQHLSIDQMSEKFTQRSDEIEADRDLYPNTKAWNPWEDR